MYKMYNIINNLSVADVHRTFSALTICMPRGDARSQPYIVNVDQCTSERCLLDLEVRQLDFEHRRLDLEHRPLDFEHRPLDGPFQKGQRVTAPFIGPH